jgi:hypothetical protein
MQIYVFPLGRVSFHFATVLMGQRTFPFYRVCGKFSLQLCSSYISYRQLTRYVPLSDFLKKHKINKPNAAYLFQNSRLSNGLSYIHVKKHKFNNPNSIFLLKKPLSCFTYVKTQQKKHDTKVPCHIKFQLKLLTFCSPIDILSTYIIYVPNKKSFGLRIIVGFLVCLYLDPIHRSLVASKN